MIQTLEKTLKTDIGGNAGGNIPEEQRQQLAEWAKLYGRVDRLCRKLLRRDG